MQLTQPFGDHQVALDPTRITPRQLKEGPKKWLKIQVNLIIVGVNKEVLPV